MTARVMSLLMPFVAVGKERCVRRQRSFNVVISLSHIAPKTREALEAERPSDCTRAVTSFDYATNLWVFLTALEAVVSTLCRKKSIQASQSPSVRTRSSRR